MTLNCQEKFQTIQQSVGDGDGGGGGGDGGGGGVDGGGGGEVVGPRPIV